MSTQYSQLSQSERSRVNLATSARRVHVATGLHCGLPAPRCPDPLATAEAIVRDAIAVNPSELESLSTAGRFVVQLAAKGDSFRWIGGVACADKAKSLYDLACDTARANPGARVRVIRPEPGSRAVYRLCYRETSTGSMTLGTYST